MDTKLPELQMTAEKAIRVAASYKLSMHWNHTGPYPMKHQASHSHQIGSGVWCKD